MASKEKLVTSERAPVKADRQKINDFLVEHIQEQAKDWVLDPGWPKIEPFIEIIGIAGVIKAELERPEAERLPPRHLSHLKKIAAVQCAITPRSVRAPRLDDFNAELEVLIGPELSEVSALPEDMKQMPQAWSSAYNDALEINAKIFRNSQQG